SREVGDIKGRDYGHWGASFRADLSCQGWSPSRKRATPITSFAIRSCYDGASAARAVGSCAVGDLRGGRPWRPGTLLAPEGQWLGTLLPSFARTDSGAACRGHGPSDPVAADISIRQGPKAGPHRAPWVADR